MSVQFACTASNPQDSRRKIDGRPLRAAKAQDRQQASECTKHQNHTARFPTEATPLSLVSQGFPGWRRAVLLTHLPAPQSLSSRQMVSCWPLNGLLCCCCCCPLEKSGATLLLTTIAAGVLPLSRYRTVSRRGLLPPLLLLLAIPLPSMPPAARTACASPATAAAAARRVRLRGLACTQQLSAAADTHPLCQHRVGTTTLRTALHTGVGEHGSVIKCECVRVGVQALWETQDDQPRACC